uniref:Glutathione peroxidase n=1 Tax=Alexandrium monilatum TaxID=311494 RepID=A0A7S4UW63_9DINO|mmetsp:Transcript_21188/g.63655  ORF Transcript_21188/g.63655 Transcript_21188/m.63655 type:complete len:100 (+) Transcript_21188:270-569(+)
MSKTDANGRYEHAMWTWVKRLCPLPASLQYGAIRWTPVTAHDVAWNFEKFLFDSEGRPCKRYDSSVPASALHDDIQAVLAGSRCVPEPTWCITSGASRR